MEPLIFRAPAVNGHSRLDARMPLSLAWQLRATVEKAYESGPYWAPRAVQKLPRRLTWHD